MTPQLDARVLAAIRVLGNINKHTKSVCDDAAQTVRGYVASVDASTAAARDEELAEVIREAYVDALGLEVSPWCEMHDRTKNGYRAQARAARAHIAKERAQ